MPYDSVFNISNVFQRLFQYPIYIYVFKLLPGSRSMQISKTNLHLQINIAFR